MYKVNGYIEKRIFFQMYWYDLEDQILYMRGVLRFSTKDGGEQSAMITGASERLQSCAECLTIRPQFLPLLALILEKETVPIPF